MGVKWDPTKDPSDALHNGNFWRNEAAIIAWRPTPPPPPPLAIANRPAVSQKTLDIIARLKAADEARDDAPKGPDAPSARDNTDADATLVRSALTNTFGADIPLVVRAASAALTVRLDAAKSPVAIAAVATAAAAAVVRDAREQEVERERLFDEQLIRLRDSQVTEQNLRDAAERHRRAELERKEAEMSEKNEQAARNRAVQEEKLKAKLEEVEQLRLRTATAAEETMATVTRERAEVKRQLTALDERLAQVAVAAAALNEQRAQIAVAAERERERAWKLCEDLRRELQDVRENTCPKNSRAQPDIQVEKRCAVEREVQHAVVALPAPRTPPPEVLVELSPGPASPVRQKRGRPALEIAPLPLNAQSGALVVRRSTPSSRKKSEADRLRDSLAFAPWSDGLELTGAELSVGSSRRRMRAMVKKEVVTPSEVFGTGYSKRRRRKIEKFGTRSDGKTVADGGNMESRAETPVPPQKRRRESGTSKELFPTVESSGAVAASVEKEEEKRKEKKGRNKMNV